MKWCLQETDMPEWMTKGKNHPGPERPRKWKRLQQLKTHNVHDDYVENIDGKN